jgi:hypothetical protein
MGSKAAFGAILILLILSMTQPALADGPSISPKDNRVRASAESYRDEVNQRPRSGLAASSPGKPRRLARCYFTGPRGLAVDDARRYERTYRCGARGITATDAQPADAPQVTEGDIRRAVSEIPMPSLQIEVQPGERTLVNVPTIFHTDPRTLRESVTLLGFDIDVEATPVRYTWRPGDGSAKTTTKPGRPYPSKDVTHTYRRVAEEVRPRVDTTYSVRFRVDDGAWQPLGQTLTAVGEPTSLEVEEAAPVLVTP